MFSVAKYHKKGFYLALISTGCRPGELLQVRKRDADTTQKRIKIRRGRKRKDKIRQKRLADKRGRPLRHVKNKGS
ncbi:MAG: hypothetical protein ACR2LL_13610 [Nitrosopumilus sp.]